MAAKKPYVIEARYIGTSELEHVQVLREWHEYGRYKTEASLLAGLNLAQTQATTCQRYEFRTKGPKLS
jgi:hypothetical protein